MTGAPGVVLRRFDPDQPRDDDGRWTDGTPGVDATLDKLKLAGRIDLGQGERFVGSDKVNDGPAFGGNATAVFARVDGPSGPRLRLGFVLPEETRKWRAANRGRTVELGDTGVRQTREMLSGAAQAGEDAVKDYYRRTRLAHERNLPDDQWPDPEREVAAGAVRGDWGDLEWAVRLNLDAGPQIPGIDAPGVGWSLDMDITPAGGKEPATDPYSVNSAARVRQLEQALGRLADATVESGRNAAPMTTYSRTASILRNARGGPIRAVLTTSGRKQDGYDLDPQGCKLRRSGCPLLVGHDTAAVPVGHVEDIRIEPRRVTGELRFSEYGRGPELEHMTREQTINSVSIQWEPHDYDRYTGRTTSWTLLECSLVGVGLDEEALVYQRSADACRYGRRFCRPDRRCVRCRTAASSVPVAAAAARSVLDAFATRRTDAPVQRAIREVLDERLAEESARQRALDVNPPMIRLIPL